VAACAKGVLRWSDEQHPTLEERRKALGLSRLKLRTCEVCERLCELACPRLGSAPELEPRHICCARAIGTIAGGTANDVIRAVVVAARASDLIDGAVLLDYDPWKREPIARVAETADEIATGLGMQYLWAPVLSALNEAIFERRLSALAIVGPPCAAQGARCLLDATNARLRPYRDAIRLIVAAFCSGMYVPELVSDLIERRKGIPRERVRRLAVSPAEGTLTVTLWGDGDLSIPLTEVQPFTRRGCAFCEDYLGEAADLSIGAVGAPPSHATAIARTPLGEMALRNAWGLGLLELCAEVDREALEAARADKGRRLEAEALAGLHLLMLGALSDPGKRAQVKEHFARLYGPRGSKAARKEEEHGGCGACAGAGC
jgi:coenzyme F420 hydrogenase subunit beta